MTLHLRIARLHALEVGSSLLTACLQTGDFLLVAILAPGGKPFPGEQQHPQILDDEPDPLKRKAIAG